MLLEVFFDYFPLNFLEVSVEREVYVTPSRHSGVCVDIIDVSTLVGLRDNEFVIVHVVLKVKSCKVARHEEICTGVFFSSLAFKTIWLLSPKVYDLPEHGLTGSLCFFITLCHIDIVHKLGVCFNVYVT